MAGLLHEVVIGAAPLAVDRAVSDPRGLDAWWTSRGGAVAAVCWRVSVPLAVMDLSPSQRAVLAFLQGGTLAFMDTVAVVASVPHSPDRVLRDVQALRDEGLVETGETLLSVRVTDAGREASVVDGG